MLKILLFFFALILFSAHANADEPYNVGFRTIGYVSNNIQKKIDINVWYPSIAKPREVTYSPWILNVARGSKIVNGKFPLIILSHDSPATRFSYHDTANYLASYGFIVAALTHPNDNFNKMDQAFTWRQLAERANDISLTIDILLNNRDFNQNIDKNRIGIVGYGAGATTALLLGGALPNCNTWPGYCSRHPNNDIVCNNWAQSRINNMCQEFPLKKSLADQRIKSIVAISPAFPMIFDKNSLQYFYPSLLMILVQKNSLNHEVFQEKNIKSILPKTTHILIDDADDASLMAPCPKEIMYEIPEICRSVSPSTRRSIHLQIYNELENFFLNYLGDEKNIPIIKDAPILTEEPPKKIYGPHLPKKYKK